MRTESSYSLATQTCHKENISFEDYQNHYKEAGWETRKAEALPGMLIAGFVKTTYHLAIAIIVGIPQCLTCDSKTLRLESSNIYRDLEEAYGFFITIFDDQKGCYHVERSQFFKNKNMTVLKQDSDSKPTPSVEPKAPDPENASLGKQMMNVAVTPVKEGEKFLLNKEQVIFDGLLKPQNWNWAEKQAKTFESFFRTLAHVDFTEFSSSLVLLLQDVQVITHQANQFLGKRKELYNFLEALPLKLVDNTHGNSQRTVKDNPLAPLLSPIAWKVSNIAIPRDELMQTLQKRQQSLMKLCHQKESDFFHATFPKLVKRSITGTLSHIGEQSLKWFTCHTIAWLSSTAIGLVYSYADNEDETLLSYLTSPWVVGVVAYGILLNQQVKTWEAHHQRAHHKPEQEADSLAFKMRDRLVAEFTAKPATEQEQGMFAQALPYILEAVADHSALPPTDHEPPPSETIWRRGWNYATSFFTR